ncbi:polysaccharide deacetylase family protein [Devosia sp. WQ 349]|uniref:polysaccharide deacetylase family protein n=1 Tax=Devosia sp. WQ 349K1 TaxID=2800329 RepID=UPI00190418BB|nr:polysaccharide deacetylase family protein [Devosia sp. WQ 349K1]MBK1795683.1 polysaccharide deacetylase family protein [Devosia sp. WQ 349K1]
MALKYTLIRAAFEALWLANAPRLFDQFSEARGVIWTLHRVLPQPPKAFAPNGILQVQPEFLAYCLERLADRKIPVVTLDEALDRLTMPRAKSTFVVLTFDDGYKDNLIHALPVLEAARTPFTLYVPTAFPSGGGQLWWQAIEDIIGKAGEVRFQGTAGAVVLPARSTKEKHTAFNQLYWHLRKMPETERLSLLAEFSANYRYDLSAQCRAEIMDWDEIKQVANHPLATIGAHTVNHYELAKLPLDQARAEIVDSVTALEQRLGQRPKHFSYPLGGPLSCGEREFELVAQLGFTSGVTTRPGGLYPHHRKTPTALPRVSLNGLFQQKRYADIFASGGLFTQLGRISG